MTRSLFALGLMACSGGSVEPLPVTDTFPAFHGSVPKNVLMISMDTFRRDHLGRFDPTGVDSTPFLTQMAAEGVSLDDHVTCSNWTFAGITCTLQGRDNEEAGFVPKLTVAGQAPWPEGSTFLAGWLGQQGYVSVASSTNGWFSEEWGTTQGYDAAFHPKDGSTLGAFRAGRQRLAELNTDGSPWFLHVHLIEPHVPYAAPDAYNVGENVLPPVDVDWTEKDDHYDLTRNVWPDMTEAEQEVVRQHLDVRYRGELTWMDDQIRRVMAEAEVLGLLDDTLVVFWNDHGEQMWEHGYQSHAYTLFREENDGFAIFWAKNIVPKAWSGPTSSIDIAPTVMQLLTGEVPEPMTGYPVGEAPDDRARFAFTVARLGPAQSVRKGDLKLTWSWLAGTARMYDLSVDPGETRDLFDAEDPRAQELWSLLLPRIALARPLVPEVNPVYPVGLPTP